MQKRNTGAWVMHFTLMETGASAIDLLLKLRFQIWLLNVEQTLELGLVVADTMAVHNDGQTTIRLT